MIFCNIISINMLQVEPGTGVYSAPWEHIFCVNTVLHLSMFFICKRTNDNLRSFVYAAYDKHISLTDRWPYCPLLLCYERSLLSKRKEAQVYATGYFPTFHQFVERLCSNWPCKAGLPFGRFDGQISRFWSFFQTLSRQ